MRVPALVLNFAALTHLGVGIRRSPKALGAMVLALGVSTPMVPEILQPQSAAFDDDPGGARRPIRRESSTFREGRDSASEVAL